jgi:hypothetical protein
MYKTPTHTIEDMMKSVREDRIDLEKREREKAARLRILEALPDDLVVTGVHMYPLYGSEASVNIEQDGGAEEVKQAVLHLLTKLPPEPVERVSASCVWTQPVGHREPRETQTYDAPSTKIIPICPVWARVSHVVKNSESYLNLEWYTMVQEMIEDPESGVHADGDEIMLRVNVKILRPSNWVRYRYTCGHSRGDNDVTVGSQEVDYGFVDPVVQLMGRGSNSQTWGLTFYWEQGTEPEATIEVADKWRTHRHG